MLVAAARAADHAGVAAHVPVRCRLGRRQLRPGRAGRSPGAARAAPHVSLRLLLGHRPVHHRLRRRAAAERAAALARACSGCSSCCPGCSRRWCRASSGAGSSTASSASSTRSSTASATTAETDIPIAWLGQTSTALAATIVANIWRGFPFMMVLLLAGLAGRSTQRAVRGGVGRRRQRASTASATSPSRRCGASPSSPSCSPGSAAS